MISIRRRKITQMKSGASTKPAFVTYRELRYPFFSEPIFFLPSGVSDWCCGLNDHPPAPALCQHRHREGERSGFVGGNQTPSCESATRSRNRIETLAARLAQHEAFYRAQRKPSCGCGHSPIIKWKHFYF